MLITIDHHMDHHMDQADQLCQLCTLMEVETKIHFLFYCPLYYEIRGRFYCLFRDCSSCLMFFNYIDQWCLALYLQEATHLRQNTLQSFIRDELLISSLPPFSLPCLLCGVWKDLPLLHIPDQSDIVPVSTGNNSPIGGSSRHPKTMDCPLMYLSITDFFVTMKDP